MTEIRSILRSALLGTLAAVPVCGWAYSSGSYVRPGNLIAQWDGIENAGRGQHDASASHPVELVNGLAQDLTGSMPARDRCFELGQGYLHFVSPAIATAVNEGHATVELVIAKNGPYCHNGGFVAFGKATRGFWAYQQSNAFLNSYSYHATVSGQFADIGYNADGTNTVAFVLGASTSASSWYENGLWKGGLNRHTTDCDADCYIGTIAGSWLNTRAIAKVFSIRVYDAVLTADELAANRQIDEMRFMLFDTLKIIGSPAEYGDVEPAYGVVAGLSAGDAVPCSAPPAWTNADKTVVAECVGYRIYEIDEQTGVLRCADERPETSFVYTYPGAYRMLEWQWRPRVELNASTDEGGTVEISDKWAGVGDRITLVATPDAGWSFVGWDGDVPDEQRWNANPSFELPPGASAFRAVFGRTRYVAADGDDGNSGESRDAAFRTLARALSCSACVSVSVGPGLFDVDAMLVLTNGSSVAGTAGPSGEPATVVRMTRQIGAAFLVSNGCSRLSQLAVTAQGNHHGRGVWLWGGGLAEDCVFTNCVSDQSAVIFGSNFNNVGGGALLYGGGTLRRCRIADCSSTSGSGWHPGGGVGILKVGEASGGLVESCIVTNCFTRYSTGGGVYAEAGVVRNTLIAGNTLELSDAGATGLELSGATAENCTIADGYYTAATTAPAVVLKNAGRLVNSIVHGNRSIATVAGISSPDGSGQAFCCCTETPTAGEGNFVADPAFADPAHGDYSIGYSACVDVGMPLAWHAGAKDLAGKDRVMGVAVDVGCHEYEPEPVTVTATSDGGVDRAAVTFAAVVTAFGKTAGNFRWTVFGADGSTRTTNGQDLASFTLMLGAGLYGVELAVDVGGEELVCRREGAATVRASAVCVSRNGSNVPPYATAATGCTDIHAALNFVATNGRVLVAPGFYTLKDTLYLDRPVQLVGMDGAETVMLHVVPKIETEPMVYISDPQAALEGVTVSGHAENGARPLLKSCGIRISGKGGTVTNCVVDGVQAVDGPGIQQAGGLVVGTVIRNNSAPCTAIAKKGGGVNVTGGLMTRCVITNNDTTVLTTSLGGGAYVDGGVLENSFVCDNECSGAAGGVCCVDGTVRNCLIAGNVAWTSSAGAHVGGRGRFYNNTVVDNGRSNGDGNLDAALCVAGTTALAKNNIVWGNRDCAVQLEIPDGATLVSHNCTENPKFRNAAGGDYRVVSSSPANDSGDDGVWADLDLAVDLRGNPRKTGASVDIGCFERRIHAGASVVVR